MALRARCAWRGFACALLLTTAACSGVTEAQGVRESSAALARLGPFDSTTLVVEGLPTAERAMVERRVIDDLTNLGVTVATGPLAAEPTAEAQHGNDLKTLDAGSSDTVLTISRDHAIEDKRYLPPTPGYLVSEPSIFDSSVWVTTWRRGKPARSYIKEHGIYRATLTHRSSGGTLWSATVNAFGDERAEWDQVTTEAAAKIIEMLIDDRAFGPRA